MRPDSILRSALQATDQELTRVLQERAQLRHALLDAITVFEIDATTQFRKQYAQLIERATRNSP